MEIKTNTKVSFTRTLEVNLACQLKLSMVRIEKDCRVARRGHGVS